MITTAEDRAILRDIIAEVLGIEATNYIANTAIAVLPEDIISSAIEKGFSDTEVRNSIFTFLMDRKEEALEYFTTIPIKKESAISVESRKILEDHLTEKYKEAVNEIFFKALSEPKRTPSETK